MKTKKTNEKGLQRHMTNAFTGNMNATIPFYFTRAKLQQYLCKNRKKSGLYLINFAPYCKKSTHRDWFVCCGYMVKEKG